MNTLSPEKKILVLNSLVEGNSIRSTVRMTGVNKKTVMRLLGVCRRVAFLSLQFYANPSDVESNAHDGNEGNKQDLGLELFVEQQNSEGGLTCTGFRIATRVVCPYIYHMTIGVIPSVAYLRMHVELAKSSLEDLTEESQKPQCLAHLNEILRYLSAVNRTKDIEAVYLCIEGGESGIRAKRPGEHFEVSD